MPWKTGRRVDRGALYVDEVSLRVRRSKQWIHAYAGRDLTVKFWHRKGDQEAIEAIHIIPSYGGFTIVGLPTSPTITVTMACVVHTGCANCPLS